MRLSDKYGAEAFSFFILKKCSVNKILYIEDRCIYLFNSIVPNGYNISASAYRVDIGFAARSTAMKKCAAQLSIDAFKQWADPEIRQKMIIGMNLSRSQRGKRNMPEEEKHRRSLLLTKAWKDKELLAKHSVMMTSRWNEKSFREKMNKIFKDKKYRERLSKIHKERWTTELRLKISETIKNIAPKYTFEGQTKSLTEWAFFLNAPKDRLSYRLRAGKPLQQVFVRGKFKSGRKKGSN